MDRKIYSIFIAAALCLSLLCGAAPGVLAAPEETTAPEDTVAPEETVTPEETAAPEDTAEPEETPAPEAAEDDPEADLQTPDGDVPMPETLGSEPVPVSYVDAEGRSQTVNAVPVDSGSVAWETGWYVVNSDVTIPAPVTVSGEVCLILADGCALWDSYGITVEASGSLTVYGQSQGTGTLAADLSGDGADRSAAISGGRIALMGGTVTADGGPGRAGIAGDLMAGGNVFIDASSIETAADRTGWSGVVFDGAAGRVYGNVTLSGSRQIPDGKSLTVPAGASLTVSEGASLTVPAGAKLTVEPGAALQNNGSILDWGEIVGYDGPLENEPVESGIAPYALTDPWGDFSVTGNGASYDGVSGLLTVSDGADVTIAMAAGVEKTTDCRIVVKEGANATITLNGVHIDMSDKSCAAFDILGGGSVTVKLEKDNTLVSGENCAGLQKNGGPGSGALIIQGPGSLTATGGRNGAGIGGGQGQDASNITIESGTVTATGGRNGAGIGGGQNGDASGIIIKNGTVTATGGDEGAGIGGGSGKGGSGGSGSDITISGGTVIAKGGLGSIEFADPRSGGAGIGGGRLGSGSHITITGGNVTATGGQESAGIGGGQARNGSDIIISGGEVTAQGGLQGAGIGGGYNGNGVNITISNGKVTATGGQNGSGIGDGEIEEATGNSHDITISGGEVTAQGGQNGAGIGGYGVSGVIISGGTVTATGGENAAGIGGSYMGDASNITISGGDVTATGRGGGAGIGGGNRGAGSGITVQGGTVEAQGGTDGGAGIGGGNVSNGSGITLKGGSVNAIGGMGGAGIGGGFGGAGSGIAVQDGTVTAVGTEGGAGIGGGYRGAGGDITIAGGELTVEGSDGAVGIGGGNGGESGRITLSGGSGRVTGGDAPAFGSEPVLTGAYAGASLGWNDYSVLLQPPPPKPAAPKPAQPEASPAVGRSPNTGDRERPGLWAAALAAGLVGLAAVWRRKRRSVP